MIYGDNDQGMIVTGDAPFIDDQHWTFFTTIIVAKNYYGTGKDIILTTFHWGWRRRGNVIAPVGHGGTVGSSKTILPSVMSEADYRAINHYYQNYLLFR